MALRIESMPDLDAMSRQQLIDYACELRSRLGLKDAAAVIETLHRLRRAFGIDMTKARLLAAMSAGRVHTRELLRLASSDVRAADDEASLKVIDVHVSLLRKLLHAHGFVILTHWGVGYSLVPEFASRVRSIMDGDDD